MAEADGRAEPGVVRARARVMTDPKAVPRGRDRNLARSSGRSPARSCDRGRRWPELAVAIVLLLACGRAWSAPTGEILGQIYTAPVADSLARGAAVTLIYHSAAGALMRDSLITGSDGGFHFRGVPTDTSIDYVVEVKDRGRAFLGDPVHFQPAERRLEFNILTSRGSPDAAGGAESGAAGPGQPALGPGASGPGQPELRPGADRAFPPGQGPVSPPPGAMSVSTGGSSSGPRDAAGPPGADFASLPPGHPPIGDEPVPFGRPVPVGVPWALLLTAGVAGVFAIPATALAWRDRREKRRRLLPARIEILELAVLDERFASGRIPEGAYRREREALLDNARKAIAERNRGPIGAPGPDPRGVVKGRDDG